MKILWVGTKPPLPAIDGGRLLVRETLRALAGAGHEVTLVVPAGPGEVAPPELAALCRPVYVEVRRRVALVDFLHSRRRRSAYILERHRWPQVAAEVGRQLAAPGFEVVHVEQLHALAQAAPAGGRVPIVLRQQNVERDLWSGLALRGGLRGPFLRHEAAALERREAAALRSVARTVALSERDAERLRGVAGDGDRVVVVRAPFPAELPAGEALAGAPPLVVVGSGGWWPNRDQERWLLADVWPRLRDAVPTAHLHVFGGEGRSGGRGGGESRLTFHPAPADSRAAFASGAVLLVPVRVASGVRMKILEAWARGVAVVSTPEGAAGLDGRDGAALLLADRPADFGRAVARLAAEPALVAALVAGGRRVLRERHAPPHIADQLAAVYRAAARDGGTA